MYPFDRARSRAAGAAAPITLPDGRAVEISVRLSSKARRVTIRLPAGDRVELVVPAGTALTRALAFLESRRGWIAERLMRMGGSHPFVEGAVIPVLGHERRLVAAGGTAGTRPFSLTATTIEIGGRPEHLARRTRDGLAALAMRLVTEKTLASAARIGRKVAAVRIGDARTRWGSCSPRGTISYSWRLVLAPEWVMDYIVAHEVAHLVEPNHQPAFWRVVASLNPDRERAHAWLRRHGSALHRYG